MNLAIGFALLGRARRARLRVLYNGEKLRIRGPRASAAVALELLDHKAEVVAAMLSGASGVRVGDPVRTPDGPGQCWQVFTTRVGVVLDRDPTRVTFYRPDAVAPAAPSPGAPVRQEGAG